MVRGGSSKQKSTQESTTQSGTKFNEDFLNQLYNYFGADPTDNPENRPAYVPAGFTGASYTPVEGGDFNKIEENLYGGASSKLKQAYDQAIAKQREELSQSGALNSPSQYLEGSARSAADRAYLDSLQQAARDASTTTLGLKQQEAARKTNFDVGQGAAQTAYGQAEGTRRTEFNVQLAQQLYKAFLNKLTLALEASKYQTGQSTGTGSGTSTQFGFLS